VEHEDQGSGRGRQGAAVDLDEVGAGLHPHPQGGRPAVHPHPALADHVFAETAGTQARGGHHLLQPLHGGAPSAQGRKPLRAREPKEAQISPEVETMAEETRILQRQVVYDGEEYTRDSLQALVTRYQEVHSKRIEELETLKKTHDQIARDLSRDLAEQKSALEYLRGMLTVDMSKMGSNFRGLLEKIPILSDRLPDRPLSQLLQEKIQVAEARTKEVGLFLSRIEAEVEAVRQDVVRLNKKMIVAAQNEEKAAAYILELERLKEAVEGELARMTEKSGAAYREKSAEIDQIKQKIWEHGARLRLYSSAEDRIAGIVAMNNNFLEMLTNLHANMQNLYEAGLEVLDDLRGNLAALATATEASELTLDMQKAMQSLKENVNKVAVLASNTSLYLAQNVERMTSQLQMYDEATKALVESNLEAERELREKRIDDTLNLARKEYGLLQEARGALPTPSPPPPA
jgi:chromosome segregation ATPase